jgi:2-polyprenyl-6-methoxyphenol hydroxylase-like FAD-dependent oxidoreductase
MDFDVIIFGGGTAGSTAAHGLARAGVKAALIEVNPEPIWRIGETLSAEAREHLQAFGLWESHLQAGHLPSHGNVTSWGWDALVDKDHIHSPHGHAWQLDRPTFESMLLRAAQAAGVTVLRGSPAQIRQTPSQSVDGGWHLHVGSCILTAHWLVDATGRRATVARHLGVRRLMADSLVAVHTVTRSVRATDRDSRTYLEAVPEGWWYTSLVPGGRRTVSFQTDAALLPSGQSWRSREWFEQHFRQSRHLAALLDKHGYTFDHDIELTSAHSGRLEHFSGHGWLAIGDAAMSFDPITGHGLLKAMQSARQVVEVVRSSDPGRQAAFDLQNEQLWQHFRHEHKICYAQERRWPTSPFWRSRHDEATTQPHSLNS